jgi:hypothetical protein
MPQRYRKIKVHNKKNASASKPRKKPSSWKINLLVLLVTIIIALVLAELIARIFLPDLYRPDAKYGWRVSQPGIVHKQVMDDYNVTRNITVQYFEHGFKRWGDLSSNKTRVWIIGDSFAESPHVSNGEEWYSYLERAFPNMTFFVYGSSGFGSLQEYFLLDEYFDVIKPDILIFQMHYNDFLDNDYRFELKEYPLSNQAERPYLEDGKVIYRLPIRYAWLRKASRIMMYVLAGHDVGLRNQIMQDKNKFYNGLYGEDFHYADFSQSKIFEGDFNETLEITAQIYHLVRQRAGDIPIYLFSADTRSVWAEEYVAKAAKLEYIPGVSQEPMSYQLRGINTQIINDGHWNLLGHNIAGEYIANYLKKSFSDKGIV